MPFFGVPLRNGAPIGLGSVAGFGISPFDPSQLFASGEQGAWYDPSDFTTMFQDAAGTTPVTAVEQPVGLIRDKSGRGNHASQATTTSRPVLSARVNLLTYTEQFNNAAWAKTRSTITANAVTAPDGSLTADKLVEDTSASLSHFIGQQATYVNATTYVYSVYARAGERNWLCFNLPSALMTTSKVAYFDLTNGVTGTVDSGLTASISAVGNNWYRCSISFTATASVTASILLVLATANGTLNYTGDGTSGIYIWGADLRVTNDGVGLPVYQRVAAATDYDTSGFPYYLRFDGTDDSLATASIDFSAGDKMSVFAGVRKLSDAAQSVVAELTASIAANNGAFALTAPNSAAANYNFSNRGTTQVDNTVTTYAAPLTNVVTGLGDISAPANIIRINGAQAGVSTSTQGTGNYANSNLYIGRRGGATLPFNGRLYSLIVRGAASTDAQIASTEAWVNGKTGAY